MFSPQPKAWQAYCQHFLRWRWVLIALGVGSVLNIVNQYNAIFGTDHISWYKLSLTYIVPYGVSSITAWYK